MATKLQLSTKQSQQLSMSQQLKQAITLLQYSTIELTQVIRQYIETNPMIEPAEEREEGVNDTHETDIKRNYSANVRTSGNNHNEDDEDLFENHAPKETLKQHLMKQTLLCHFNDKEQLIAEAIIDELEDNGRLVASDEEIKRILAAETEASIPEIQKVLTYIQNFEPAGVATRNITECLLMQLKTIQPKDHIWEYAKLLLENSDQLGSLSDTKKLLKKINMTEKNYTDAIQILKRLNPDPGLLFSSNEENRIDPELTVKKTKGKWTVYLNNSITSTLTINKQYSELIQQNKKNKSFESIKTQLLEAKWFLSALQRRNETLLKVANYIIKYQEDFLEKGPSYVRPMNIIDVSSMINMHESTVSRVTNGKYIATPWGVYELKHFLPSHLGNNDGSTCSSLSVKELIKDLIEKEDSHKILSDEDLAVLINEHGIKIARRTVTKYREALKILPSYQRAQIKYSK